MCQNLQSPNILFKRAIEERRKVPSFTLIPCENMWNFQIYSSKKTLKKNNKLTNSSIVTPVIFENSFFKKNMRNRILD